MLTINLYKTPRWVTPVCVTFRKKKLKKQRRQKSHKHKFQYPNNSSRNTTKNLRPQSATVYHRKKQKSSIEQNNKFLKIITHILITLCSKPFHAICLSNTSWKHIIK